MAHATPWFVQQSPELGGAFDEFYNKCKNEGALDKKTKELPSSVLWTGGHILWEIPDAPRC
jgi:hypothetical protein